jgi:hypothetical protein
MHVSRPSLIERLDKIYLCTECKEVFLFRSDIEDHELMLEHSDFTVLAFE